MQTVNIATMVLLQQCVCVCISWLESDFYSNFAGSFLMSLLVSLPVILLFFFCQGRSMSLR